MLGKIGEVFSFLGKSVFFKNCVFNNVLRPKKKSYYYHSNCQNNFLALINRFLRFVTLDNLRKMGQTHLFTGKVTFFQKFVFSATSQVLKIDLITSTLYAKISFWLLWIVLWGLSNSTIRKNMGQIQFFTEKVAAFRKICVLNNFLGSKEKIL